ncbi:hypothetical protein N7454_001125 [Penicillium verhagenii]|nr:hypothetical protein N7454_001125 [Penicillium verhagenii]
MNLDKTHPVGGGAQWRTPEQYTKSLQQACEKSQQSELFSRVQYQFLADYLKSPSRHDAPPPLGGLGRRGGRMPGLGRHENRFTYVVVHTIAKGSIKRQDFDYKLGLEEFWAVPDPEPGTDQVIFVRGSLSPAWIEMLGSKYKIDPEFFRRHLQYLSRHDYSDLIPLPSASANMLFLPVASLYTCSLALSQEQVTKRRKDDYNAMRSNHQAIRQKASCGESVVRKVSTLSDRLLSVEHDISIYTRERKSGGRFVVILLDNGLNLNRADGPPCFTRRDSQLKDHTSNEISLNPILVHRPDTLHIGLDHPRVPDHDRAHATHPASFCPVVSLLPFHFGMSLGSKSLSSSPRVEIVVLLTEVFQLVTSAECQFLNSMYGVIREQLGHMGDEKQMEHVLNTLVYIKALLDEHKLRFQQAIAILSSQGTSSLGEVSNTRVSWNPPASQFMTQGELCLPHADFQELLNRNKTIGDLCVESMSLIMNTAMLKESQKAVERADDQKRLTILAYFFLPISIVTSVFGMNVKQFGTGSQNIWVPAVVLVPVVLFALILSHPQYFKPIVMKLLKPQRQNIPSYQTQGATRLFSFSSVTGRHS